MKAKNKLIISVLVTYLLLIYLIIIVNIIMDKKKEQEPKKTVTEQAYLDICSDFKELINKKDLEMKKYKQEILRYRKMLGKFYGLARTGEELINNYTDEDDFLQRIFNIIRSDCSNDLYFKIEEELGLSEEDAVILEKTGAGDAVIGFIDKLTVYYNFI